MLDCADINEKWFYLTQHTARYIVVPGEAAPHRTCKHKSHIEKVMCLTAIARPRKNPDTGRWWDGKIGTWFYVEQVAAHCTSKNRAKGTLVWKSFKVGRKESIEMYVTKLQLLLRSGPFGQKRKCASNRTMRLLTPKQKSWVFASPPNLLRFMPPDGTSNLRSHECNHPTVQTATHSIWHSSMRSKRFSTG